MLLRSSSARKTLSCTFVDVSGSGAKRKKLRDGAMYEIMYYEACGRLLFSANADKTATELWCVDARGNSSKLINNCGAIYDSSSSAYYSCSMMSNDGNHLIYFKDVATVIAEADDTPFSSHPTAQVYGTLMLYRLSDSELRVIAKNAGRYLCLRAVRRQCPKHFYSVVKQTASTTSSATIRLLTKASCCLKTPICWLRTINASSPICVRMRRARLVKTELFR